MTQANVDECVAKVEKSISEILKIDNCHLRTLMLIKCCGFCQIVRQLRCLPPSVSSSIATAVDALMTTAFVQATGVNPPSPRSWRRLRFSTKYGGLGLRASADHVEAAWIASCLSIYGIENPDDASATINDIANLPKFPELLAAVENYNNRVYPADQIDPTQFFANYVSQKKLSDAISKKQYEDLLQPSRSERTSTEGCTRRPLRTTTAPSSSLPAQATEPSAANRRSSSNFCANPRPSTMRLLKPQRPGHCSNILTIKCPAQRRKDAGYPSTFTPTPPTPPNGYSQTHRGAPSSQRAYVDIFGCMTHIDVPKGHRVYTPNITYIYRFRRALRLLSKWIVKTANRRTPAPHGPTAALLHLTAASALVVPQLVIPEPTLVEDAMIRLSSFVLPKLVSHGSSVLNKHLPALDHGNGKHMLPIANFGVASTAVVLILWDNFYGGCVSLVARSYLNISATTGVAFIVIWQRNQPAVRQPAQFVGHLAMITVHHLREGAETCVDQIFFCRPRTHDIRSVSQLACFNCAHIVVQFHNATMLVIAVNTILWYNPSTRIIDGAQIAEAHTTVYQYLNRLVNFCGSTVHLTLSTVWPWIASTLEAMVSAIAFLALDFWFVSLPLLPILLFAVLRQVKIVRDFFSIFISPIYSRSIDYFFTSATLVSGAFIVFFFIMVIVLVFIASGFFLVNRLLPGSVPDIGTATEEVVNATTNTSAKLFSRTISKLNEHLSTYTNFSTSDSFPSLPSTTSGNSQELLPSPLDTCSSSEDDAFLSSSALESAFSSSSTSSSPLTITDEDDNEVAPTPTKSGVEEVLECTHTKQRDSLTSLASSAGQCANEVSTNYLKELVRKYILVPSASILAFTAIYWMNYFYGGLGVFPPQATAHLERRDARNYIGHNNNF